MESKKLTGLVGAYFSIYEEKCSKCGKEPCECEETDEKGEMEKPESEKGEGKKEEKDCVDKEDKTKHNCAKKVCHEEFGEGTCIFGQHAEPDRYGYVSHYDVLFEHGVEKGIPTTEMEILVSEMHKH